MKGILLPPSPSKRYVILFGILVALGASFYLGWLMRDYFRPNKTAQTISLRLQGYHFIQPLLVCDNGDLKQYREFQPLESKLHALLDDRVNRRALSLASVYFQDLTSGHWTALGASEKFYPASLGKIPIMMAYYKLAETDSELLTKKITYAGGANLNAQEEIQPTEFIESNHTYTIEELIEYMLKYSDNNAAALLYNNIDHDILRRVYHDLQVPIIDNVNLQNLDAVTTKNFSLFFRTLYNATYLSREYSEKALSILGETDFKKGLIAGVPSSIDVANKYGLVSIAPQGVITSRELHDCGLVYHPTRPYFLCVMTKTSSTINNAEQSIQDISHLVYQEVDSNYQ